MPYFFSFSVIRDKLLLLGVALEFGVTVPSIELAERASLDYSAVLRALLINLNFFKATAASEVMGLLYES